ncbi:MAG: hypothetical protein U0871_13360 [Gemmataceae bacterium]
MLRLIALAATLALLAAPSAPAGFYTFTGTVTEVRDPNGAFSPLAVVGAPVVGTFGYSDTAAYPNPFQYPPQVTSYFNNRFQRPTVTGLAFAINGVTETSDPYSLTNLQVGAGVPPGDPFRPAGDTFRYFDTLADNGTDGLVDYDLLDPDFNYYVVPFASIVLNDPTGRAFASQALPQGPLPLAALTNRYGEFSFFDGNGEDVDFGAIRFRIDQLQAVAPVSAPPAAVLAALGAASALGLARRRPTSPTPIL